MTIDDEIRTALREDAGEAAPPPDGWDDVRARAQTHTRRRRATRYPMVGVAAAVAIAAIVAGVAALRTTSQSEPPLIATKPNIPSSIVSVIDDNLVVLDARTGRVRRTLAGPRNGVGPTGPTVTPDGTVYFTRSGPVCDIARVSLDGGNETSAGPGLAVEASPDGRWLAIVSPTQTGCTPSGNLGFVDLELGIAPDIGIFPAGGEPFELIGWSADSLRVIVRSYPTADREPVVSEVPVPGGSGRKPAISGSAYPLAPLGTTGLLVTAVPNLDLDGFRIVSVDPATGEQQAVLASKKTGYVVTISPDSSGRHLLYWVATDQGETQTLWRKSRGERSVKLRTEEAKSSGGLPAVWVPGQRSRPPATTTPATTPATTPTMAGSS